jgi:hypothetical protein
VTEIKSYPELVDAIWAIVQGSHEDRERVDFMFSEEQVARQLSIPWVWESDACVFGVAQAFSDLVGLEYCKGVASYNGHRWRWISPSPYCPDVPPSTLFITPPIIKLPPLFKQALQFIHEQTLQYENGITFYSQEMRVTHQEAVSILLPTTTEADQYNARGTLIRAMSDIKDNDFVKGSISSGYLSLWPTLKGACWLLVAQPLLKLEERASRLTAYPEVLEATRLLANAYSESQSSAAGSLYIAIEKLENASGGERGLINFLGQPRAYIGDLKQSVQRHRHATTQAQADLNHQQCLERATDIIEKYITLREQGGN